MKNYSRKIKCFTLYLLLIGWLAGCSQRTEIYINESASENESVSENKSETDKDKDIVSNNQINQLKGNQILWRGLSGQLGGDLIISNVKDEGEAVVYKLCDGKGQLTISQVDIAPDEEQAWFMGNIVGTRELYRCDFSDTVDYFFYTAYSGRDDKYTEMLIHCGNSYYYVVTSGLSECKETLGNDILIKLGKNERISYICTFYNVIDKEKGNISVSSRTERAGENISGIFVQNDNKNEFSFKGTIQETQGVIEHDYDGKEQKGYLISLELFLNGEKIQETEEFVCHEMGNTDQDCPVWFGDYNGDGFVDFCISVFYVNRAAVADNYYIYNSTEKRFVRVPIADEKGIELEYRESEDDSYNYCVSREYLYISDVKYEEHYIFWCWDGYEIKKFAEAVVITETVETAQRKAVVTDYDLNGERINQWFFESGVNTFDEVWEKAEDCIKAKVIE